LAPGPGISRGVLFTQLKTAWHDGTRELVFEAQEFLERLAAITPWPETSLLICHGVLALALGGAAAWSPTDALCSTPRTCWGARRRWPRLRTGWGNSPSSAPGAGRRSCTGPSRLTCWRVDMSTLWGPSAADHHPPRSRRHPEDPRSCGPLPLRVAPRPGPTRAQRRRGLIGSVRGAADARRACAAPRAAISADSAVRLSVSACRLTAPLCRLSMPLSKAGSLGSRRGGSVRCASGSRGGRRPCMGGYVRAAGPRTGRPPPQGIHVDYPRRDHGLPT